MSFFRYYRVGSIKIFGAPVYVHASVYILSGCIALSAIKSPAMGLLALLSYLGVIFVHEVGHAFVANRVGLSVTRIDIAWFHGCCHYVTSRYEWHEVIVSWGGVIAQLGVAALVLTLGALGVAEHWQYFGPILVFLGYINLMIAGFNSLPSSGLDGATMWRIVPLWFDIRKTPKKRKPKSAKRSLRIVPKDE